MSLSIYKNKSITQLLRMLSSSLNKYTQSKSAKIRSLIKEIRIRDLSSLQQITYHKLVRKFSEI